ncbi:MAG: hypothetical protein P8Y69_07230 [Gammaproteobacteria bacterium]
MRPDKNKADGIARILTNLEGELEALCVSLDAYERSAHAERFEALRWHLPILRQHCQSLAQLSRAQSRMS